MSRMFGEAIQTGVIVPDVKAAMNGWLEAGIGPFYVAEKHRMPARYRGQDTEAAFSVAFVCSGDMQYELIQPIDEGPSAFRDYLQRNPQGGLHHLAYLCDDITETLARTNSDPEAPIFEVVQEFVFPDGQVHEVYLEPVRDVTGRLSIQLVSRKNQSGVDFFDLVRQRCRDWDGSRPIRPVWELFSEPQA